tara:strand:+ start:4320 stop:5765 length:1446 start_codon:yes stop_codon:yes gene_type:complete
MARSKNTNKLSSGFYRAHDFLRFGDVLSDIKYARKGDYQKSLKQMEILQSIDRLGFKFPKIEGNAIHGPDYIEQICHYGNRCNSEYDAWINSLKFQFESGLLQKVIPPNAILNNFFSDLEIRMPHEQTLLIENHPSGITFIVSVQETTIRSWFRKNCNIKAMIENHEMGVKNEKDFWITLDSLFKVRKEDEHGKVTVDFPWYKGLDQEMAAITLTINCNIGEHDIVEPERFTKNQLEAMTSNTSTLIPFTYFVPLGQTVKFYDKVNAITDATAFKSENMEDLYHLACAFTSPFTSPGFFNDNFFKKNYFGSDENYPTLDKQEYEKLLKRRTKNQIVPKGNKLIGAVTSHWWLARQVFLHMGIMNHPEFKSLCVEKLKMKGIQPNKSPYSAARPYKKGDFWRPPFEHYVVTINIPDEVSNESNSTTQRKRHHLVRGHYMRTATKGFVWRKSHWRGNKEVGVVTKDYVMDIDERLEKQKRRTA